VSLIGVKCTQESPLNLQAKHVDFYSFMESVTVNCQMSKITSSFWMVWKYFGRFWMVL